ncbi:glycerophosphodiester phosphodiesterase [Maribacter sp. X9]|uniref:glycerophosphodiester phosphodiesterase n=1 Tax=Maribacter sp. X9 TaxID=3402159 RepID=UPI003AF3B28B
MKFVYIVLFPILRMYAQDDTTQLVKPKNGNTYVIAHRGAHLSVPENTIAAYENAINMGCDFVEIDLRKTKDGHFVSVHNETVDAYFDHKSGRVGDFTLSELRDTPLGKNSKGDNEYVPTFEEILRLCKGRIGIYLDLKEADIASQVQLIKKYGMEHDIIWYIYPDSEKEIMTIQELCNACWIMPDPGPEKKLLHFLKKIQPKLIASDMSELTESFVATAHVNGSKVFVDDKKGNEEEWLQMISWGTDGIQTDQPGKLIELLKREYE